MIVTRMEDEMTAASKLLPGLLGLALLSGACTSPQYGSTCPIPEKATEEQRRQALANCFSLQSNTATPAKVQKDVDILFLIDNSRSMTPKQRALAKNIPKFIRKIETFGANYHVAVATSDVGSTKDISAIWQMPDQAECNTFKGDDGQMQIRPCTSRTNVSAEAKNACAELCNKPAFANAMMLTNDGLPFIKNIEGKTNVPLDMVLDPMTNKMVDQGAITAFQCAALVGDRGCGMESPLEGAKRALDGHLAAQSEFRRPNASLAVIFITDEDDCSVQMARREEAGPPDTDCSTPDPNASWRCFNTDYRCVARSMQCDQPMNTQGEKTNCKERPDSFLEPVKKYYDFFSKQTKPGKLVVSGIWTLPSTEKAGKLVVQRSALGSNSAALELAGGANASCRYTGADPMFSDVFGNAQRRLSAFAQLFPKTIDGLPFLTEKSICDIDGYEAALEEIRKQIEKTLEPNCLDLIPKVTNGKPVCFAGEVDETQPDAFPDPVLDTCSSTCCDGWAKSAQPSAEDAGVQAACDPEPKSCYCAVKSQAGICTGADKVGWVGGIWRANRTPIGPGKLNSFRCAGTAL